MKSRFDGHGVVALRSAKGVAEELAVKMGSRFDALMQHHWGVCWGYVCHAGATVFGDCLFFANKLWWPAKLPAGGHVCARAFGRRVGCIRPAVVTCNDRWCAKNDLPLNTYVHHTHRCRISCERHARFIIACFTHTSRTPAYIIQPHAGFQLCTGMVPKTAYPPSLAHRRGVPCERQHDHRSGRRST